MIRLGAVNQTLSLLRYNPSDSTAPIDGLLNGTQRAEHPDYEPDLDVKKAETDAELQGLL